MEVGGWAICERPLALRPRLATGLPLSTRCLIGPLERSLQPDFLFFGQTSELDDHSPARGGHAPPRESGRPPRGPPTPRGPRTPERAPAARRGQPCPYATASAGRRSAHGTACSSSEATARSSPSPSGRPISWTASGRPSSPWNRGSEIAGRPVMLHTAVNGVKCPDRR